LLPLIKNTLTKKKHTHTTEDMLNMLLNMVLAVTLTGDDYKKECGLYSSCVKVTRVKGNITQTMFILLSTRIIAMSCLLLLPLLRPDSMKL